MEIPKVWINKESRDVILIGDNLNNNKKDSSIDVFPIIRRATNTFTMYLDDRGYANNSYQLSKGWLRSQCIQPDDYDMRGDGNPELCAYMFDESKAYSDVHWLKNINPDGRNCVEINGEMWFIDNIRIPVSRDDEIEIPLNINLQFRKPLLRIYPGEYIVTLLSESWIDDNDEIKRKTMEVLAYELEGLKWELSIEQMKSEMKRMIDDTVTKHVLMDYKV